MTYCPPAFRDLSHNIASYILQLYSILFFQAVGLINQALDLARDDSAFLHLAMIFLIHWVKIAKPQPKALFLSRKGLPRFLMIRLSFHWNEIRVIPLFPRV